MSVLRHPTFYCRPVQHSDVSTRVALAVYIYVTCEFARIRASCACGNMRVWIVHPLTAAVTLSAVCPGQLSMFYVSCNFCRQREKWFTEPEIRRTDTHTHSLLESSEYITYIFGGPVSHKRFAFLRVARHTHMYFNIRCGAFGMFAASAAGKAADNCACGTHRRCFACELSETKTEKIYKV